MFKRYTLPSIAVVAGLSFFVAGCSTSPQSTTKLGPPQVSAELGKPILASAAPAPTTSPAQPTTRPSEIIAQVRDLQISRDRLDALLYETYGLQMTFDLVELELAKNWLWVQQKKVIEPADVQRERDIVFAQMFQDAQPSDYEGLYNQFLQKEKYKRAEFEMRAIETSAVLRKIIEPMMVGQFTEPVLRRGYEIMYGANRQIADITLSNTADAGRVLDRLNVKHEPWDKVAAEMSIDPETKNNGGLWAPFSAQSKQVPQAIIEHAFSMDVGQISDTIEDGRTFHIIKVVNVIDPKAQKFEDVKDVVKKQMEDKLTEKKMKEVRQQLQLIAQQQVKFDEPILKAQWDEILAKQQPASTDKKDVLKQMDQHMGPDLKAQTLSPK